MPDLSACYFCGTALDEPLSEYPVVPKPLQPTADQQRTVVLCDGCRRKLGRVLDTVIDALDERPIDASVQQGLGGEHGAVVDEAADLLEDESATAADVDEADAGTAETDASADDEDDSTDDAKDGVSAAASATSGWSTVNVKHSNARRRSGSDADDGGEGGDDANDASEASGSGGGATGDDDSASEDDGGASEDGTASASDAGEEGGSTGDADESEEAAGAGVTEGQSLSRLEYSKVMRLLENREFPVDREEIRVVATNAYEIRPEEFDAIVDAAVKRGLLVEENGKFVEME